jgi:hypothetical protein
VLDFKENAEKILEKEKSETLNLNEFSRAILECKSPQKARPVSTTFF